MTRAPRRQSVPTPSGDLAEYVRRAQPLALELVRDGLDVIDADETLESHIELIIGHNGPKDLDDDGVSKFIQALEAAYAIGLAVGMLVRPELFAKGGTR
jgi:hypothetical protein